VHKIAEAATGAFPHFVLATAGFPEIRNWRKFGIDGSTIEPPVVQCITGLYGIFFPTKLNVCVSNQMFADVIANIDFFQFAILKTK